MGKQASRTLRITSAAGLVALASFSMSCTDPVRDRAIERLGEERDGIPQGPEHRPGQPCVLCHSEGGPASDKPFAIAGTIFANDKPDSVGAAGVRVFFIDASSATRTYVTNSVGNFYIPEGEWSDLTYPFKTGIRNDNDAPINMSTTVNREGSCNFCHKPSPGSPYSLPGDDPRESIGQIFLKAGGGT
jgi:hypothetical protein